MKPLKIALIGAGSRSFGPSSIRDVLLSSDLYALGIELALMDIAPTPVQEMRDYATAVADRLQREVKILAGTDLEAALDGAAFVIDAIEISRDAYWAMDFHVPRKHGFRQMYGENGGPGSHFHALRNMRPIVEIARKMESWCPEALLINYTNPMHKLCQAACALSGTATIGLCHGVYMGIGQLAFMLGMPVSELETAACGINHFTWFQELRSKSTGEDLYVRLREVEKRADWFADWHEIGLSRILFRRFGLYPSPGANHIGEYIGWSEEFYANELLWFYDPMDGHPWAKGEVPEFLYTMGQMDLKRPFSKRPDQAGDLGLERIEPSGEAAVPIIEAIVLDRPTPLAAVNVPNRGSIPDLPEDLIVEVPATVDAKGILPTKMEPLPEPVSALIRTQASIQKLLVQAFVEESKEKLLQALLLEPTVGSYRRAVEMMEEMLVLQRDLLPPLN
jgi:alpha-galactosidase